VQQEADALLLFLWAGPKGRDVERGVYTGKLFEYIGAGRPILAIGSTRTVASDLIADKRLGVLCETTTQVALQLRSWLAEKKTKGGVRASDPSAVVELTRESQVRRVESFLAEVMACTNQP
jgi:hypothetical protein